MKTQIRKWTPRVLILLISFRLLNCAHKEIKEIPYPDSPAPWAAEAATQRFSVMAYNVENLFDTEHDEGKEDFTYLPLSSKNTKQVQDYARARTQVSAGKTASSRIGTRQCSTLN